MFNEQNKYLAAERHAIEKSIYLASEKANRNLRLDTNGNLTQEFLFIWINDHSAEFREAWPTSICRKCKKVFTCHDCLKEKCDSFDKN